MTQVITTGLTGEKTSQEGTQHQRKDIGMLLRVRHLSPHVHRVVWDNKGEGHVLEAKANGSIKEPKVKQVKVVQDLSRLWTHNKRVYKIQEPGGEGNTERKPWWVC